MATTSISLASVALAPSIRVADRPIPGLLIGGRAVSGGAEWLASAMRRLESRHAPGIRQGMQDGDDEQLFGIGRRGAPHQSWDRPCCGSAIRRLRRPRRIGVIGTGSDSKRALRMLHGNAE
jgi:hypothetical protein